jgi:coenzyme Q-binding protein COQ10
MRPFRTLRLPSRPNPISQRQDVCPVSRQRTSTRPISTTQRPTLPRLSPSNGPKTPTRAFGLPDLSSFLPKTSNNGNNSPHRVLTATRNLPYNPALLYEVIASVESYSQFLPFLNASTVTARDSETGYPTQAFLTVGYGPLSETFTSQVICDVEKLTVEAKSGAEYAGEVQGGRDRKSAPSSGLSGFFPGANEGLFEYLTTRWELVPLAPAGAQGKPLTKVNLEVRFEFRSEMHATLMSAVEGKMAGVMIEAFEKRIREVEGRGQ